MGHTFSGWYQSADNDNTIDTIAADYKQNITLYAKWTYGVDVSADGLSALMADLTSDYNPYLIRITDADPDLSVIKSALTTYPSITIDMDLSQCTEMTEIADNAFAGTYRNKNKNLHSIVIPDGVDKILGYAFAYCDGLKTVTIGGKATIGYRAFSGCSGLTNVTITSAITQIPERAFSNCSSLTDFTIPDTVTTIGPQAFRACSGITSISLPSSVTSIGKLAFTGCWSLTSVEIPSTIQNIGSKINDSCSKLTSVTIKAAEPPTIANDAFITYSCFTDICVPADSVNTYKETSGWSTYSDKIEAIHNP